MKDWDERPHTRGAYETMRMEERRKALVEAAAGEECELCGARMYGLHCKLVCPNCGYRRDCSDP